ncbi:hypothetical protein D9M72_440480 [compost metagenome]
MADQVLRQFGGGDGLELCLDLLDGCLDLFRLLAVLAFLRFGEEREGRGDAVTIALFGALGDLLHGGAGGRILGDPERVVAAPGGQVGERGFPGDKPVVQRVVVGRNLGGTLQFSPPCRKREGPGGHAVRAGISRRRRGFLGGRALPGRLR